MQNACIKLKNNSVVYISNNSESISLRNIYKKNFKILFNSWSKKLETIIKSNAFNLVVSDNLCTPLSFHDNCVLLGSFLWHDVVKKTLDNNTVLESEKVLFRNSSPTIFAMEGFVMPEISKYGNVIEFPSLLKTQNSFVTNFSSPYSILITFGRSGDLSDRYKVIIENLNDMEDFQFYYDSSYSDSAHGDTFDFSENSFSKLSLIIARPGIGIISDSIKYKTPLIVDSFYSNKEIEFNAQKIEELGIGKRLDLNNTSLLKTSLVEILNDLDQEFFFLESFYKINTGGVDVISDYILSNL